MTQLPENPALFEGPPALSVSELSRQLRQVVEQSFRQVRVRGEISQPKLASSGHFYLRLKDSEAVIDAVCWKKVAAALPVRPEEGLEVICTGRLTTYAGRSSYQIVIDSMEVAGQGALLKLIEERRKRLAAEGLFDEERKKPLPFLPNVIGVVSSPTGAVIRDILHRLADRCPRHVLLWPVLVQGEHAAIQIATAIRGFNALSPHGDIPRPDLIIVARGGGSLEDLMAFNEESVVRAAAASAIPLISAIGHETDTTLIDFAADRRAPTPTAAAEMAVPVMVDLAAHLTDNGARMARALHKTFSFSATRITDLSRSLSSPTTAIATFARRCDDAGARLQMALKNGMDRQRSSTHALALRLPDMLPRIIQAKTSLALPARRLDPAMTRIGEQAQQRLTLAASLLEGYSPQHVLRRGYAMVSATSGEILTSASDAAAAPRMTLTFADGRIDVQPLKDRKRESGKPVESQQGILF
ncbi:MAG TPA: exodeoxyribonuclease VII large subunit [Rhodospirillaceae bacterium]|nr:MAG: hypothetical protein A2018_01530 [Alphaproteobacteria bacterium GWF2_58_20]HAU28524.1 exodeoxyribonuclease VII large subunit [Rhodospirillaceae bacterium]